MDKVASWTKFLKIVSVVCIVVYALFTILGIAVATSLIDPDIVVQVMGISGILQGADASMFVTFAGIVITVSYAFQLLATIAVLRGVKNPSKMKLGMVLYGIILVISAINMAITLNTAGSNASLSVSSFAVAAFMFYGAYVVHRSTK